MPTTRIRQKSTMSPAEARILREQTGMGVNEWATLLRIAPKSVRNIESPASNPIGASLERLWRLYAATYKKSDSPY